MQADTIRNNILEWGHSTSTLYLDAIQMRKIYTKKEEEGKKREKEEVERSREVERER